MQDIGLLNHVMWCRVFNSFICHIINYLIVCTSQQWPTNTPVADLKTGEFACLSVPFKHVCLYMKIYFFEKMVINPCIIPTYYVSLRK